MAYPPPPYADAVCGTFVAGEALAGTWWVYPSQSGLALGGLAPGVEIEGLSDIVLTPTPAGLALGGTTPGLNLSPTLQASAAGLALGSSAADAYRLWLLPSVCADLDLVVGGSSELVLAAAPESELVLEGASCL